MSAFGPWMVLESNFQSFGESWDVILGCWGVILMLLAGLWEVMFGSWGLLLGVLGSLCSPKLHLKAIRMDSVSHLGSILTAFGGFCGSFGSCWIDF